MTLMDVPYTREELEEAQITLLQENELFEGAYIRPLVYLGYGVMGLYHKEAPVNVSISAWEWGAYLGEEGLKKGIRLKIASMTRTPNTSGMGKAKAVANYLNSQMAKFEAVEAGYDEALPPSDNALESITQATVIDLAHDMGIEVIRRRITREEIYIADECFLTGTAAEAYFDAVAGKNPDYIQHLTYIN